MRRNSLDRLLLSLLIAISMVAGYSHAASAVAPALIVAHQHAPGTDMSEAAHAGQMMHMPAQPQPAHAHHHDLAGCACCSMACCPAVLPSEASVRAAQARVCVAYAPPLAFGRGVIAALEPDPPRPSTL